MATKKKTKTEIKREEMEIIEQKQTTTLEKQQEIRELENFFVNGTVADITKTLETLKEDKVNQMIDYARLHEKPIFNFKTGDVIGTKIEMNPIVVNNMFFKTICPLGSKTPLYNAEQMALLYEYYLELVTQVNDKIGDFPTSLASFCKLIGISTRELKEYRNSYDMDMRTIVEKIYDEIGDNNLSMAQLGIVKGTPTVFKLKTQNEMVEKNAPNVNITLKQTVDPNVFNERLERYKDLLK